MKIYTFLLRIKKSFKVKFFEKGFTLIEALAGIFILTTVIGGPMTIAGRAAQDVRQSREVFIATYLAQEAIELLRFKRDSIFLECSDASSYNCPLGTFTVGATTIQEFPNEAAWRKFKEQFGSVGSTSCFSTDGCAFDIKSLASNVTNPLAAPADIYAPSGASCSSLYQDTSKMMQPYSVAAAPDYMYFCSTHKGVNATDSFLKRVVTMTSSSTFSGLSYDAMYGDEVKVDVTVYYTLNGTDKKLIVTDYLKPRA